MSPNPTNPCFSQAHCIIIKIFSATVFVIMLAGACFTDRLTISVLEPPAASLPGKIQRLSIFPLAGYAPDKHRFDSITDITIKSTADVNHIRVGYLDGMYEILSASQRFQKVILSDSSFGRVMKDGRVYWDDLLKICKHDTTNYILLLQKAVTYDLPLFKEGSSMDGNNNDLYYGSYKIINNTKWAIIDPEKQVITVGFVNTDSLNLEGYFGTMADNEYLLYRSCYTSGYLTGTKICPYWKDTLRAYFRGPGFKLQKAAGFLRKNRWSDAAAIWNELAEGTNNSLAAKASYNMALAWEHDDQLDQSMLWLNYADSLDNKRLINQYKKILRKRIEEKIKLDSLINGN